MAVIILPGRFKSQPRIARLKYPGFWLLVDIQNQQPISRQPVTRTLNATAKLDYGLAGANVNFVAAGDYVSYGSDPNLQLSTMTGVAVLEVPAGFGPFSIFYTNYGPSYSAGFHIGVESDGTIQVTKADIAAIGRTTKTIRSGSGATVVAWSYDNISGLLRIVIDGVLETFTSAQTFAHGIVARNKYYSRDNTYSTPRKEYLFALSASAVVSDRQLIEWSLNPWQIFKAPPRRLWAVSTGIPPTFNPAWARNSNAILGGVMR